MGNTQINRYTLEVKVNASGGCQCTNPNVSLLSKSEGVAVRCVGGNIYQISSLNDLSDQCLLFLVTCDEGCGIASQEMEVCFCSKDSDCGACQECKDGICINICPDKICKDGFCVPCLDNDDCPEGFVCTNEGCICPSGIIIDGKCVECDENTPLPNCAICIDGVVTQLDCGTLNCNPNTGECQECVDSSHCSENTDGRTCCVAGKCECCPGFVFDYVLGRCVEKPECIDNDDCDECETCVAGKCEPVVCPNGERCYEGDCIPWPCKDEACNNGFDCGEGCGCLNGECVPCAILDCTDPASCEGSLGCECVSGNCEPSGGCFGNCSTEEDCAEGCTCYGGICTPCANFNDPACGGGGACTDTFKIEKGNCTLKATLSTNTGCACSPITIHQDLDYNSGNLTGTFYLRKGSAENAVEASALPVLDQADSNIAIAENEEPVSGTIEMSVLVEYTRQFLDINGNLIVEELEYQEALPTISMGNLGRKDINITIPYIVNELFNGQADTNITSVEVFTKAGVFTFPNKCVYDKREDIHSFVLGPNGASSDPDGADFMISESKRDPLFVWFKSTDGNYVNAQYQGGWTSGIFRKYYVPASSNGLYVDELLGPDGIPSSGLLSGTQGELWSNFYYQAWVDCGCGAEFADAGKVTFCNPEEYDDVTFLNCNKQVEVGSFIPCKVNRWRETFLSTEAPVESQVYYTLTITGVDGAEESYNFVSDGTLKLYQVNKDNITGTTLQSLSPFSLPNDEEISKVELVHSHDNECIFEFFAETVDVSPEYSVECLNNLPTNKVLVEKSAGDAQVVSVRDINFGPLFDETPTNFEGSVNKNEDTTLVVEFDNGCTREIIVEDPCEFTVKIDEDPDATCDANTLLAVPDGGAQPYTYLWSTGETTPSISVTETNLVSVTVTDAFSNEADDSINPTISDSFDYALTESQVLCVGDPTASVIFTPLNVSLDGILSISANGQPAQSIYNSNGEFVIPDIPTNSPQTFTYQILHYDVNGCRYQINETVVIEIIQSGLVNVSIDAPSPICTGNTVTFNLSGTTGVSINVNGPDYNGSVTVPGSIDVIAQLGANNYSFTSNETCGVTITGDTSFTAVQGTFVHDITQECSEDWTENNIVVTSDSGTDTIELYAGGFLGSAQSGQQITIPQVTDQEVTVIVTTTGGCTYETTFIQNSCDCNNSTLSAIIENGSGVPYGSSVTIDSGDTITLEAVPSGGNSPYTYQWNNNGGTAPSIDVSPTVSTSYSVTVTDANECEVTVNLNVIVNSIDCNCNLILSPGSASCSMNIDVDGTGCSNYDNIEILGPNGFDQNISPSGAPYIDYDVTAGGNGLYTLKLENQTTGNCPAVSSSINISNCCPCPTGTSYSIDLDAFVATTPGLNKDIQILTDIRVIGCGTGSETSRILAQWSGSNGPAGTSVGGNHEYVMKNESACSDEDAAFSHFGSNRTIVTLEQALDLLQTITPSGITWSNVGNVITVTTSDCSQTIEKFQVTVFAYNVLPTNCGVASTSINFTLSTETAGSGECCE